LLAAIRADSLAFVTNPWYALRLTWFAIAEDIDSPLAVTNADSALMGIMSSREFGREASFFQGPGESPDINGEGRGVTSAIALSIGEDSAELGADPIAEVLPTLLARTFLMLGVLVKGMFVGFELGIGIRDDSLELRAALLVLAAVTV
jgi:hypothetical protein